MKRYLFLSFLLMLPFCSSAQQITRNYDQRQLLQVKDQLAQWFSRGKRYLSEEKPKLAQKLSRGKPYLERQKLRAETAWSAFSAKLHGMTRPAMYVGGGMVASLVLLIIIGVLVDDSSSSSTAKSSGLRDRKSVV